MRDPKLDSKLVTNEVAIYGKTILFFIQPLGGTKNEQGNTDIAECLEVRLVLSGIFNLFFRSRAG